MKLVLSHSDGIIVDWWTTDKDKEFFADFADLLYNSGFRVAAKVVKREVNPFSCYHEDEEDEL